jgi:hypothetical protein
MKGSFKSASTKSKREILSFLTGNTSRFVQTNVIPLVRKAWKASFAKNNKTKAAIANRGCNPLNYKLLHDPELNPTRTTKAFSSSIPVPNSNVLESINQEG